MAQNPSIVPENTGIGRVVHAQWRYMPEYGIEFVSDPAKADLRIAHANGTTVADLDILHSHGLYWTGDINSGQYSTWHHTINQRIIADVRRARAFTVPSDWVGEPFRREMGIYPAIIGHGIDATQWKGEEKRWGYVLWNKNRAADVCNPLVAWELADRGVPIVSTFAPSGRQIPDNMRVTGQLSAEDMKPLIQKASIYLATTKETFGIGTLEAMASGVPILGYDWGGTSDLVAHKYNGCLVKPGDIDGLMEGYEYILANWTILSQGARALAEQHTWDRVIKKYIDLYEHILTVKKEETHGVAVVITNYNYAAYVGEAIESVLNQTVPVSEIIVVDDGSTDHSADVIQSYADKHKQITFIRQRNRGVAAARNRGIAAERGDIIYPYIVCLDADDRLDPRYIETLQRAMIADRSLGVAYTGLSMIRDDGSLVHSTAWPIPFDWEVQAQGGVPPGNCIPSGSMFRRSMWERAGGYKQEFAPAEDAEFWTRGLGRGFTAKQVTREGLFHYRVHGGGAHNTKPWVAIDTWIPWIRDKQFPIGAPSNRAPIVRSYSQPLVSIIDDSDADEFGPNGHTFRNWEMIDRKSAARSSIRINGQSITDRYTIEYKLRQLLADPDSKIDGLEHTCDCKKGDFMGCCGGKIKAELSITSSPMGHPSVASAAEEAPVITQGVQWVRMRYTGTNSGAINFQRKDGKGTNTSYRGGNNPGVQYINAHPDDVGFLLGTGRWEMVERAVPQPPPPAVITEGPVTAKISSSLIDSGTANTVTTEGIRKEEPTFVTEKIEEKPKRGRPKKS